MAQREEAKPLVNGAKESSFRNDNQGTGSQSSTYDSIIDSSRSNARSAPKKKEPWMDTSWVDRDAVYFGVRMSVCITVASFAILLRDPGDEFVPQAMWIVVTVLFVCWFPNSLDAASVVEKCIQRLYGTFLGASMGLSCGFLSLLILYSNEEIETAFQTIASANPDESLSVNVEKEDGMTPQSTKHNAMAQSAFLMSCIALYTFVICWGAIQFKVRKGNAKIITKFNYACILSLLTFYISILPFYSDNGAKWRKARWRVTNVIIGVFLGAALSITVFPRSTKSLIQRKLELQLKLAGEASQAVLHAAADQFSETAYVLPPTRRDTATIRERLTFSQRLWRRSNPPPDHTTDDELALTKYEAAIGGWRTIKVQLNNLRYDPFRLASPDMALEDFRQEINNIVARIQRIQTTVVLLDGIVKNDPKHNFSATHINRLARIGTLIQTMLDVTLPNKDSDSTETSLNYSPINMEAYTELKDELASIRRDIVELAGVVASSPQENAPDYTSKLDKGLIGRSNLDLTLMSTMVAGGPDLEEDASTNASHTTEHWNDPFSGHVSNFHNDCGGRGAPKHIQGSRVCALLFVQLVEHLALRSLRTFQAWKQCDAW